MHVIIVIVLLAGWLLCRKRPKGKDNIFGRTIAPFYQISEGAYELLSPFIEKSNYMQRLCERLKILYPNKKENSLIRQYICYKASLVLLVVMIATFISYALLQKEENQVAVSNLSREDYWGNEKQEVLSVEAEGMKEQEVTVVIPERKYSKTELAEILKKLAPSLEKTILGENEALDCVTSDLELVREIPDTKVEVSWELDSEQYMDGTGVLVPDAVTQAGAVVNLTAVLSYEDEVYRHSFAVYLKQPELSEEEQLRKAIIKQIDEMNVSNAGAEVLKLPEEIDGRKVAFVYPQESYGYKIFIVLLVCAVLIFFLKDEYLQKELEIRKNQMLLDYSEIVSKLTLLLGAGMTIRSALEKLACDYDKKHKEKGGYQRFAYDEILFICREMQGGVSERNAIDMLAVRCQIPCYTKLCSLLLQNLKKGSKGMAESLSYEAGQAFEERKNTAKRMGEEAGTKLLIPMVLMLVIMMAILILPAFLTIS